MGSPLSQAMLAVVTTLSPCPTLSLPLCYWGVGSLSLFSAPISL
jgi:hypothetical protein